MTGGRSYAVTSQRVLHQCIDSLVQKLQSGVVIHFEKIGADPPPVSGTGASAPNDKDDSEENSLSRCVSGVCPPNVPVVEPDFFFPELTRCPWMTWRSLMSKV